MDFVVLGFGIGALWVILGLLLRDHGPRLRRLQSNRNKDHSWSDFAVRVAWRRTCRVGGLVLAVAGGFVGAATLAAVVARVRDQVGLMVVLAAALAAFVGMVIWAARYRRVTTGFGLRRPRIAQVSAPTLVVESETAPTTEDAGAVASSDTAPADEELPVPEPDAGDVAEPAAVQIDADIENEEEQPSHVDEPVPGDEAEPPESMSATTETTEDESSDEGEDLETVATPSDEDGADPGVQGVDDSGDEPEPAQEHEADDPEMQVESDEEIPTPTAATSSSQGR